MKLLLAVLLSLTTMGCLNSDYKILNNSLRSVEGIHVEQRDDATVIFFDAALFGFDSFKLESSGQQVCNEVAKVLTDKLSNRYLYLEGHSDFLGDPIYNEKLSMDRADSILNCIFDGGYDVTRLDAIGYGSSYPKCDNRTSSGRACNRRVEIVVVKYKRD